MTELDVPELRRWTIVIPAPCPWLTSNNRQERFAHGRLVKAWRRATVFACERAELPRGIPGPVRLDAIVQYIEARPPVRDRLNLEPTMKAIVDGLTPPRTVNRRDGGTFVTAGYGLILDDSDRVVLSTKWALDRLIATPRPAQGRVVLRITDHSPAALF